MVSIHDTVPHTVNIIEAGNPPGQPIEVALEAGKTVSFQMPEKIMAAPNKYINGGTHTTGSGFNFRADRLRNVCPTIRIRQAVQQRDSWRS